MNKLWRIPLGIIFFGCWLVLAVLFSPLMLLEGAPCRGRFPRR